MSELEQTIGQPEVAVVPVKSGLIGEKNSTSHVRLAAFDLCTDGGRPLHSVPNLAY
jgi:hypothetical protein